MSIEHRGTTPARAIVADDLREVVDAEAPFVTLLLATDAGDAQAATRWEQRWRAARRELEDHGVAGPLLGQLDEVAADAHRAGGAFYAVADAGSVRIREHWPEPPAHELVRVARLPALAR